MTPDKLRALADALDEAMFKLLTYKRTDEAAKTCQRAADYLRAQADAQPVAWRTFDGEGNYNYCDYELNEDYADEWNRRNPKHVGWVEPLYPHPAPAAPQAEPCIGNDSACPCQDGDACHYKDAADGTKAWPVPQAEPKREPLPGLAPTHRCPACGALWRQCDDASWNLRSASCCGLCDAGRVELVRLLDKPKRDATCLWSRADEDTDTWETACRHAFTINEGTPTDNQMTFCCYCGRPIDEEGGSMTDAQQALAQVREAMAAGPTPGEWVCYDDSSDGKTNRIEIVAIGKTVARIYRSVPEQDLPNARLIAACSPANMTAILAHVEAQAAEIERLTAERDELRRQLDEARTEREAMANVLPGHCYMDPPDGGDVPVLEQLRRMAKDAARYRWLRGREDGRYMTVYAFRTDIDEVCLGDELDAAIDAAMGGGDAG